MAGTDPERIARNTVLAGKHYPELQRRKKAARKRRNQHRRLELEQIRDELVGAGLVEHGLSPVAALQRLIDDSMIRYLHEQMKNDKLRAAGKTVSDARERTLAREAAHFTTLALQYNIADRQTRVQERRTNLLAALLQKALRHPDIALSERKIRKIPKLLEQGVLELQADVGEAARWDAN